MNLSSHAGLQTALIAMLAVNFVVYHFTAMAALPTAPAGFAFRQGINIDAKDAIAVYSPVDMDNAGWGDHIVLFGEQGVTGSGDDSHELAIYEFASSKEPDEIRIYEMDPSINGGQITAGANPVFMTALLRQHLREGCFR